METSPPDLVLRSNGELLDKRLPLDRRVLNHGLVTSLKNFLTRGHAWKMVCMCANIKTGECAVADERGQIYSFSIDSNEYHAVRLASTPISAMAFIEPRNNQLIVAYENGTIIIVDTKSKDIVGNIQSADGAPVRIIKSHPTKSFVIMADDDRILSIWDLRYGRSKI